MGFLGDVLLDRGGGCGEGVNDSFRNDETTPVTDWSVAERTGFCLECCLRGLAVLLSDGMLDDFRTVVFLGDESGNR